MAISAKLDISQVLLYSVNSGHRSIFLICFVHLSHDTVNPVTFPTGSLCQLPLPAIISLVTLMSSPFLRIFHSCHLFRLSPLRVAFPLYQPVSMCRLYSSCLTFTEAFTLSYLSVRITHHRHDKDKSDKYQYHTNRTCYP